MTPLIFTHYVPLILLHGICIIFMTLYIILSIIIVYNYAILHIIQLALEAPSGRANNIFVAIYNIHPVLSNHFYL